METGMTWPKKHEFACLRESEISVDNDTLCDKDGGDASDQNDERDAEVKPFIVDGDLMISGGTISLQSDSLPTEFRKMELMKLNPNG